MHRAPFLPGRMDRAFRRRLGLTPSGIKRYFGGEGTEILESIGELFPAIESSARPGRAAAQREGVGTAFGAQEARRERLLRDMREFLLHEREFLLHLPLDNKR